MNNAYITAIGTASPTFRFTQMQIANFMQETLSISNEGRRKLRVLYRQAAIKHRYSVLPDYNLQTPASLYQKGQPFPSTAKRMEIYQHEALPLAIVAARNCLAQTEIEAHEISHLITVSCTGMYAPGLDIELVQALGLSSSTQRTCINFMGCYASFNALKVAQAICKADSQAKVLIVAVELCTLHLQDSDKDDDLLANTLFADGAGAMLIEGKLQGKRGLTLTDFYCDLAPEGQQDMSWHIHDTGFLMQLSSYVPEIVGKSILNLAQGLLQHSPTNLSEIEAFALHPGGKKILEVIQAVFQLPAQKLAPSYEVLQEYGNMSSVSIIFVLKKWWDILIKQQKPLKIMAIALGPGLTLESALLDYIPASITPESFTAKTAEMYEV